MTYTYLEIWRLFIKCQTGLFYPAHVRRAYEAAEIQRRMHDKD